MKNILSAVGIIFLLVLTYYFATQQKLQTPSLTLDNVAAEVITSKNTHYSPGSLIEYGQELRLKKGSSLTLEFETGDRLELFSEAQFQIDKVKLDKDEKTVLFLDKGRYKIVKNSHSNKLITYWQNQFYNLSKLNFKSSPIAEVQVDLPREQVSKTNSETIPIKIDEESFVNQLDSKKSDQLTNNMIREIIEQKTPLFQRCHNNALREIGDISGKMLVSFKILPRGKTESVILVESSIENKAFQECVKSVFERSKFRAFNGPPLSVNYPVVFE